MEKYLRTMDVNIEDALKLEVYIKAVKYGAGERFLDAVQENGYNIYDFTIKQLKQIYYATRELRLIPYAFPYVPAKVMKFFRKMSPVEYSRCAEAKRLHLLEAPYDMFNTLVSDGDIISERLRVETAFHLLRDYPYDRHKMNTEQMRELRLAYECDIDLLWHHFDHTCNSRKMKYARYILPHIPDIEIPLSKFSDSQLKEIYEGISLGIPVDKCANPEYSAMKMKFINAGIENDVPYEEFLNRDFSDEQLMVISEMLSIEGALINSSYTWLDAIIKEELSPAEMVSLYNEITERDDDGDGHYSITYKVVVDHQWNLTNPKV